MTIGIVDYGHMGCEISKVGTQNQTDELKENVLSTYIRSAELSKSAKIRRSKSFYSLVLLLISNLTNELRLYQFLASKTSQANKSLKTDENGAHQ